MKADFDPAFGVRPMEPVMLRGCYRRNRRQDPVATIASLAIVGLLGSAFAFMSPVFVKKQANAPVVVSLLELPDDPPPQADEPLPDLNQPVPPPTQVVTPPPQVALPAIAVPVIQQAEVVKPTPPAPQLAPTPPAPAQTGPVNGGDLSAQQIVFKKPVRVPLESRRQHEEGVVVLALLLAADGSVAEISVAVSSGFPRLDRAALDAVRGYRWSPLMRNGVPVMARGRYTLPFIRDNGPGGRERRGQGGRSDHDGRDNDGPDGNDRT